MTCGHEADSNVQAAMRPRVRECMAANSAWVSAHSKLHSSRALAVSLIDAAAG